MVYSRSGPANRPQKDLIPETGERFYEGDSMKDAEIRAKVQELQAAAFQKVRATADLSKKDPVTFPPHWVSHLIFEENKKIEKFINDNLEDE